ncbi:MAG: hypothetical protein KAI72_05215, partial [Candidatus Pacebacteria bacterium]|nr:hypothetical protein [Candidatus Paceibacterota bacterium]
DTNAYTGTFAAGTDYNATDGTDAVGAGTNNKTEQVFSFVNETADDFHLVLADSGARDSGTDLSGDADISFSNDIDGDTHSGTWDIGADEGVDKICRSVAPLATAALDDHNSHTDTITISDGTAAFSAAIAANVGVGDVVLYDSDLDDDLDLNDSIAFIDSRTDSTHYALKTETGEALPDLAANDTWAIYRAYTSLANAESGTQNTSIPISFTGGNRDLVANNEQWNIACYANGAIADTSAVIIDDWTTDARKYIKIYTPASLSEVGTTQRSKGVWDNGKYKIEVSTSGIEIYEDYVRVEGLQLKAARSSGTGYNFYVGNINQLSDIRISHNIIAGDMSGIAIGYGVLVDDDNAVVKFWNNIIYGFVNTGQTALAGFISIDSDLYLYNNTICGCYIGFQMSNSAATLKNNIAYNNLTDYALVANVSHSNNLSKDDTSPDAALRNQTVSFLDEANNNFHLTVDDIAAKDQAESLASDSYIAFSLDIEGHVRPFGTEWDIGADEYVAWYPDRL